MLNIFFNPDKEMVNWLISDIIKDRTVFDIGCGTGELLMRLSEAGHKKLVGVEPFGDYREFQRESYERTGERIHFFPNTVQDIMVVNMLGNMPNAKDKLVGLLCRPCHHYLLTKGTYDIFKTYDIPLYYIGLEENLEQDLEQYDISYMEIKHKGTSEDGEKVYKLL